PLGEPAPPADHEHLVEVELVDGHHDVRDREPGEANDLADEDCVVRVLQRVVEGAVPAVDEDNNVDQAQRERDHDDEQPQRGPAILGKPVGARDTPAIARQSTKPTHGHYRGTWLPFAYMHCVYAMSYRCCTSPPAACPFRAPNTVPLNSPPPAPTAAPRPGFPAAAPIAAPSPAPMSVPMPAPSAVSSPAIRCGVVPASRDAQSRHTTSSVWN